jgi:microcin C transport system permease protein
MKRMTDVARKNGFIKLSPLAIRRWKNFRANKRAFVSLWMLLVLFVLSCFSELIANDRPIMTWYKGGLYFPVFARYAETTFGGTLATEADYNDPYVAGLINQNGWMLWPLLHFSFDTINYNLPVPAPAPPSLVNLLGTDDQGRDILAQIIYGLRTSVLFGLILTLLSPIIGVAFGAIQGYFGGKIDIIFQRLMEIYASMPLLYILIIITSIVAPSFMILLVVFLIFEWTAFVGIVRAEFLRARNFDYVRAARALGAGHVSIMFKHILPNALASTFTFIPFILNGSIAGLASLDFLGFGLPASAPSLGRLISQGKANLEAPWIGLAAFVVLAFLFSIIMFIGEGIRDAFDPKKMF